MARTDTRYRESYNLILDLCDSLELQSQLPSELVLAKNIDVSRTVVRNVLQTLHDEGIILWEGRSKTLVRKPLATERFEVPKKTTSIDELQSSFLDWVVRFDVPPGTSLNVTRLAKKFDVAPHTLQEFLSSLLPFGLVERRDRGGWMLLGFTIDYALELSDFRTVLEVNAVKTLTRLPDDHPVWETLASIREQHVSLLERIDTDYHDFSSLDEAFHNAIHSVVKNRFITDFQKVIALIFNYHYQWDKSQERVRNEAAVMEHLDWIDALLARDEESAQKAALIHMATSKETLIASLKDHNRT